MRGGDDGKADADSTPSREGDYGCGPMDGPRQPHHFGGHPHWRHHGHPHWHSRVPLLRALHRSLFLRVYLHGIFLLLIVGVSVSSVALVFGARAQWREFPERFAQRLATRWTPAGPALAALQDDISLTRDLAGLEATLYTLDGHLLASNIQPPLAALPVSIATGLSESHDVELENRHWAVAAPVRAQGRNVGYVLLSWPSRTPYPVVRFVAILAVLLVALAIGSVPLARGIVAPLLRLTETARALGRGDLSVRSGLDRPDEVGELARAFDDMAERLERLILSEKELLANVSHELRTPMARIRFALELAADGDAEEARRYLLEIGTDLNELERLVDDVLTTARLDLERNRAGDGTPPLRKEWVDAAELLDSAAQRFRSAYPDRGLVVDAGALPEIEVDPILLRRVIDNLLENARKYADPAQPIVLAAFIGAPEAEPGWEGSPGAELTLDASEEEVSPRTRETSPKRRAASARLVFEVRDRGPGIAPEDLPHLFSPFFRTDRSRTRGTGGVGLGLTLARRVVEAHGGLISAESVVGEGTTMRFSLPLAPERSSSEGDTV